MTDIATYRSSGSELTILMQLAAYIFKSSYIVSIQRTHACMQLRSYTCIHHMYATAKSQCIIAMYCHDVMHSDLFKRLR